MKMKKFRIVYWMGSMLTDRYIMAKNESDALKKFKKMFNKNSLVCIIEIKRVV